MKINPFKPVSARFAGFLVTWALPVLLVNGAVFLLAPSRSSAAADAPGGIALSPSVVMLKGAPGQAHRQALSLTNSTSQELTFDLVAEDVVAEGRRRFLPAGERADSIAATAVFSPTTVVIPAGTTGTTQLTVTVPRATAVRAIAATFRSRTPVAVRSGVGITASLGALVTFTLSDDARIETSTVSVAGQTSTTNLKFTQAAKNVGTEPLYFGGAAAILDSRGALVARMPIEVQRLLPGERLDYHAEYPTLLAAGQYRVVFSLEHVDQAQSAAVDFTVPASPVRQLNAGRTGDVGPR